MASSFFALFDDIATLLDDVSVMTRYARYACPPRFMASEGQVAVASPTSRSTGTGAWKRRAPGSSAAENMRSLSTPNS